MRLPPIISTARRILDICLLRRGPQDLPFSRELLVLLVAGSLVIGYPAMRIYDTRSTPGLNLVAMALFTLVFVYGVLGLRGFANRFVQTATAVFGIEILMNAVALLLLLAGPGPDGAPSANLAMIGLVLWNLLALGHVLRHALALPLPGGILMALAYTFAYTFATRLLPGG